MHHTLTTTAAILGALAIVQAKPTPLLKRDILTALPERADEIELKFQPLLDFDSDGCYNTAAIDPSGNTNPGRDATDTPQGGCRDPHQLEDSNVYSRKRCNNGICAIMYEYYFEKDQALGGTFLGGHRHDWENIVVFTKGDTILRVAPSCHGKYDNARKEFPHTNLNPMIVYHKDWLGTHCFRFANDDDVSNPGNDFGEFYRSPLVGWDNWPDVGLRDKMLSTWNGGVGPKLDDEFGDSLAAAAGDAVAGFDPHVDE
ncbi:necrosis inducing protein-domain-containing protein [Thelonectria olida]|uniref:Necrosis inducing protein-domain-containing protein n=1 Tax=Thelonectria olida TaxID=1576542 RepID=A0A9P9AJ81_9HYPO|nr:necrosis inducing protein-domain-containing protein [Thelonectria olida]